MYIHTLIPFPSLTSLLVSPLVMAAASRSNHHPHALAVTVAFIISLIIFLLLPLTTSGQNGNNESLIQRKKVLGSKPPACVDKCLSCRPCVATLVAPSHKNFKSLSSHRDDDTYFLLSWKCRCGNKLFQA